MSPQLIVGPDGCQPCSHPHHRMGELTPCLGSCKGQLLPGNTRTGAKVCVRVCVHVHFLVGRRWAWEAGIQAQFLSTTDLRVKKCQ